MQLITQKESRILSAGPITKNYLKQAARMIVQSACNSGNALDLAERMKILSDLLKLIREDVAFVNAVVDDLDFNRGPFITQNGATIEKMEAGVQYDFSHDEEWCNYKSIEDCAAASRKAREAILKSAREGAEAVIEETGEVIIGANKKSKSTYKITLQK